MDWVWRKRVVSFDAMTNLSPALRSLLAENFRFHTPEIVEISGTPGSTRKFLTRMEDGSLVESVIIPAAVAEDGEKADRTTLCVSSQVGCAFGWQILRFRPAGAQAQPLRGRNHRTDTLRGIHCGKTSQQPRLHGNGRTPR